MRAIDRLLERPLPIFLGAALLVGLGLYALRVLPFNRTPQIEIPYAFVVVPWVGASPEDVESEITLELEERLNTLSDLRHSRSVSAEGVSYHILEFEDRTDMTESVRSVRDEVAMAEVEFPDDVDAAFVREMSFDDLPIVFFTLHGGSNLFRLREIAEDLAPSLESVAGVSRVDVFGGLEPEVRVHADPRLLAWYGLTLLDLERALGSQGTSRPAGQLRGEGGERLIRTTGEFQSLEDIRGITVARDPAGAIALRDVARVELGHVRRTSGSWLDGAPSVTLIARRRSEVNTVETVRRLRAVVDELRPTLPPGIVIEVNNDASQLIGRMVSQLGRSGAWGFALVVLVLLVALGWRQALLVSSVLPFALLFALLGLWVLGMSISNMALFSLILVIGLVVDGAIIVGEAIHAEREQGHAPVAASRRGLQRVGVPVFAAHLTTVFAFLPMVLMVGVMGQFMSVMPKVVALALAGSLFVDHLLLPAAMGRIKGEITAGGAFGSDRLTAARALYARLLDAVLAHRPAVLAGAAAAFALALGVYGLGLVDSIFLPKTDQGRFTVNYALPLGTPLAETNRIGHLLTAEVRTHAEVARQVLTTGDTGALAADNREGGRQGPEYGRIAVELVEIGERDRSQKDLIRALRTQLDRYAGVEIDVDAVGEGPGVGAAIALRVQGEDLDVIADLAEEVERRVRGVPGAIDVRTDFDRGRPDVRVDVERADAGVRFGISAEQVSAELLLAFQGLEAGHMWIAGERVPIRVKAPESFSHTADQMRDLPLRAQDGSLVPLGEVASVTLDTSANAIFRYDSRRTITVRADAAEGHSSVTLDQDVRRAVADLALPGGVAISYGGETEERDRSYASLWDALKWGLVLIYLILAIQFNSLRQPLIVLAAVPLSVVGVTVGLLVTGTPFSFMVLIGIVSLTGIVVNDGIVLVDAINRHRAEGTPLRKAVHMAGAERLRPVLLTTVTTIAGLLPLTLNITLGGEFWVPLGVTVISGLMVATGLTLLVVPSLYEWIERGRPSLAALPTPRPTPADEGDVPTFSGVGGHP